MAGQKLLLCIALSGPTHRGSGSGPMALMGQSPGPWLSPPTCVSCSPAHP